MSASEQPSSGAAGTNSWDVPSVRDLTGITLDDFQVERLLGRGGMGEVYLARQVSLNRPVALKVLRPDLLTKPTYLSRFEAEATTVAKLNHPNIVHIYTLGNVDGIRFIAMEYVQGTNLKEYLIKKGALDLPLAMSIMKQAGVAIGAAGELGLIHRDIKPENLLMTRKGQVKIADFGLCRDQDADHRLDLTQPGITLGTPLYMSPEQAQGHALDHRSDLYSLGVTFYHMLAGEPPFRAESPLAVALKHIKDTPINLAVHRPDLPPELVGLVMKLIAKDPDERFQSAAEMLRDLSRIRGSMNTTPLAIVDADQAASTSVATGSGSGPNPTATAANGQSSASGSAARAKAKAKAKAKAATAPAAPRGDWLEHLRPGGSLPPVLVALCLLAGMARGWFARPADLLSEGAVDASGIPALWMAAHWVSIPRQKGPEEQYRYAQLRASRADQEAAWIAVSGHFPNAIAWTSQAYIQLARVLLRRHDSERLQVFAHEIERWNAGRSLEHEHELATIIRAAGKALGGDLEGVINDLNSLDLRSTIDAALLELALEVTEQATHSASRPGTLRAVPPGLRLIQNKLLNQLSMVEIGQQIGRRRPG